MCFKVTLINDFLKLINYINFCIVMRALGEMTSIIVQNFFHLQSCPYYWEVNLRLPLFLWPSKEAVSKHEL